MSRICPFTGKKTRAGRSIARKGKAKYLGGVGRKTTGITKRRFKANIQRVRAVVDGRVCRINVSAKAIRMGLIIKPPKRNWPGREAAYGHRADKSATARDVPQAPAAEDLATPGTDAEGSATELDSSGTATTEHPIE